MITDEELADLPEDAEHAFVLYERRVRERLNENLRVQDENQGPYEPFRLDYMSHVLAAVKVFELDILGSWSLPSTRDDVADQFRQFVTEVDAFTVEFRLRNVRRVKEYSVAFDAPTKAKLRHHLEQMREIVDRLEVSDRKREALIKRITALNSEIDRDRTRFEAAAALIFETSDEAEPRLKRIADTISGIFYSSKEAEREREPRKLPAPPKRIEGPKRPQTTQKKRDTLDDDVPF